LNTALRRGEKGEGEGGLKYHSHFDVKSKYTPASLSVWLAGSLAGLLDHLDGDLDGLGQEDYEQDQHQQNHSCDNG